MIADLKPEAITHQIKMEWSSPQLFLVACEDCGAKHSDSHGSDAGTRPFPD